MKNSGPIQAVGDQTDGVVGLSRLQSLLSALLSVVTGMVDLIGFFTLGSIFALTSPAICGGAWRAIYRSVTFPYLIVISRLDGSSPAPICAELFEPAAACSSIAAVVSVARGRSRLGSS